MRATEVVFGRKRAFCKRFLRWSLRFLWMRHRHPSFVMLCSFTNRGRLLADGPRSSACRWPVVVCGWPLVPKTGRLRMACGRLRTARGRLRMALGSQNGSSTDGLWSSTDGPCPSTDGPCSKNGSSTDGLWSSTDGLWPSTDGPWSSTDDPWFQKTGRLRMARGRLRIARDGPWPSADGPSGARTWLLFVVQPRCKYRVVVLPVVVQRQVPPCGLWCYDRCLFVRIVQKPVEFPQVPIVRTVLKPAEIPQLQFLDMPVVVQRQMAMVLTVRALLEIHICRSWTWFLSCPLLYINWSPTTITVASTVFPTATVPITPLLQSVDKVADILVVTQRQIF